MTESRYKQTQSFNYIYGPVPSRRLGFSLGIDLLPFKTCSLNCIYCQLGKTTQRTIERRPYVPADSVLEEIKVSLASRQRVDYITFSGSGEPTLHSGLGELIRKIKEFTTIPVAVITNSTLLPDKTVQDELMAADLLVPSIDATSQSVFERINRPCYGLKIELISEALRVFRQVFSGLMWLEIMSVKGVNDTDEEISKLLEVVQSVEPDKVHLNTVVRPPSEIDVRALTHEELYKISQRFGSRCQVIAPFQKNGDKAAYADIEKFIKTILYRRPTTAHDLARVTGYNLNEIIKRLMVLTNEGIIECYMYQKRSYYRIRN